MKWKIDYPYVVCIVFLIGTGIWMNYLSIKKQGLEKEVEWFRQETERFGQFYQQVTDLYFTGGDHRSGTGSGRFIERRCRDLSADYTPG